MTRYEFFRKRIAPLLFLGMVGLIAYDACHKQERTHATIIIDLGDAEPQVRVVDAELFVEGEVVGRFHRAALPDARIGPCRFETAMPADTGTLHIDVELASGGPRRVFQRQIRAPEGAKVTVSLGPELR